MMRLSLEDRFREWLQRRWRQHTSVAEVNARIVQIALDAERESIALAQQEVIQRCAFVSRAQREDGWERAELLAKHNGPK